MQFCNEHGIPHSAFLEWPPDDRAKAMAQLLESNDRCHLCGTAAREWDPTQGGSRYAYEAVAVTCPGCYAKSVMSDETSKLPGVTIELRPTGTVESAKRWLRQKKREQARRAKKT